MYENFYGFREKPFALIPDSGFLYLSDKHRMALTLLEYGLMNQTGFTVISGDIGTGKTTLLRQLLHDIDPLLRVGLISNTHPTFGDLMQWIALAFELPHKGKDKVQLYQEFMDFIIQEYAQGRRPVLIIDEAQNMSVDALEELRMLSNVNADKNQVLQVILVGQRELRQTLQQPALVQFAQRIGIDYHLKPLEEEETSDYIRHRCKVAGSRSDLFSEQACTAVYTSTAGVPRLINLLCDTALVYGFAEQRERIDAQLIMDVVKDKQKGGLFGQNDPSTGPLPEPSEYERHIPPLQPAKPVTKRRLGGAVRVIIAADSELQRLYLSRLLGKFSIEVVATVPLRAQELHDLNADNVDVLLVELDDDLERLDGAMYELLEKWSQPVLFNDSLATEASLSQPDRDDYGRKLSQKIYSLVPQAPQSVA